MPEPPTQLPTLAAGNVCGPTHATDSESAKRLRYKLASLEARYYSEEGVAMVLSCENLATSDHPAFEPNAMNGRFATAFRHYAGMLNELRSDLAASDVASVVELVAKRDLDSGGLRVDE